MNSFNLWYHPLYTDGIHDEARFPKDRYQKLLHRLEQSEQFSQITIRTPEPISRDSLLLAHDVMYVDAFLNEKLDAKEMRRIGLTPWTPKIIERTLCLTGVLLKQQTMPSSMEASVETWQEEPIMRTGILVLGIVCSTISPSVQCMPLNISD